MPSRKDSYAWIGVIGLLGLLAFAGSAGAAEPDDGGEPPDDDDGDDPFAIPGLETTPAGPKPPKTVPTIDLDPSGLVAGIVDRYFDPNGTRTGVLYQIRAGENPTTVAARALGVKGGHGVIAPYVAAMARPEFNQRLYDVVWYPDDGGGYRYRCAYSKVPSRYTAVIGGERYYIGDAFCRKHARILDLLRAGQPLERGTGPDGAGFATARKFGLIWLPKVTSIDPLTIPDPDMPAELESVIRWG